MYLYFVVVLFCLHLFQSFLVSLKFVFKFIHILHQLFLCWWQNRLLLIHQAQNMFSPDPKHTQQDLFRTSSFKFFVQCRKQRREAVCGHCNNVARSCNVYTCSAILAAWYHFTQMEHWYGDLVSSETIPDWTHIWIFSTDFHKNLQYQISWKPVQWEPWWYKQTERWM